MKKSLFLFAIVLISGCGGSLTEEQRKKLREGMEAHKIVKLSDAQITTFALEQGQRVYRDLEHVKFNTTVVDSIENVHKVRIRWVVPGGKNAQVLEQQLIEAYISELVNGSLQENIQKIYNDETPPDYDSLLYSKPVVTRMADGVENLEGVWNVYLSRKEVILSSTRKK